MGTWKSGTLDTNLRCFDLLCTGKCDLTSTDLKLRVESVDKIPNFFTKNSEGKIVFSTPSPMSVITTPKGHGTWIQIELKTINGVASGSLSGIAKHICLGIKKRSENNYFDVIHAAKLTSEYVDLFDTDAVELVPLLSKTEVTSNSYELIKPSDEIIPSDFSLTGTSFDFGSVYRVNIKDHGAWISQPCNLSVLDQSAGNWANYGNFCAGLLSEQNEKQLLAVKSNGKLARSADGLSWFNWKSSALSYCKVSPTYGHGMWCITKGYGYKGGVYSDDKGETWQDMKISIDAECLAFGNGTFMTITSDSNKVSDGYGKVYTSQDGKNWTKVGAVPKDTSSRYNYPTALIYGNGKWICNTWSGICYQSKCGGEWEYIGKINKDASSEGTFGGCYANGYFYVVNSNDDTSSSSLIKSATGEKWEEVTKLSSSCYNITYYKNKLYSIDKSGTTCYIGIPNS